ncbi:hypothetical protein SAMN05216343_11230 [Oscillibacter sp. PC13]|nr:hypothetical protein SAMN05216343_11230 [Oscillibacter sp. PC13]
MTNITSLLSYPIATQTGQYVTLEDISEVVYSTTLPTISRQDVQLIPSSFLLSQA